MDAPNANGGDLGALVTARFEASMRAPEAFFVAEADTIAKACWAMARRFHQGGRLLAFGVGASATDAQHVAVEFVHPVIVGKRALPALALTNDSATLSCALAETSSLFRQILMRLARPQDMAMGLCAGGDCSSTLQGLAEARRLGLLTLGLFGAEVKGVTPDLDFTFIVPESDPMVVQETQETLYHVLWELTHIFFEHEGLLR
jgi:D-sedoheptulose 7-phosphate isomerase